MSGILGIGGGLGIVLAGPILQHLSYHWLFWIPLVVTAGSAVAATVLIPESPLRAPGNIHWLGAALLSGWLVGLLLAVSESSKWGWGSGKTIGLIVVAIVTAALWVRAESRTRHPAGRHDDDAPDRRLDDQRRRAAARVRDVQRASS